MEEKVIEWFAILTTGIGVVFSMGKNKKELESVQSDIDCVQKSLCPETSDMRIVRSADIEQILKRLETLEKVILDFMREKK